jgi:ribose 1,5-bisphosphokinase
MASNLVYVMGPSGAGKDTLLSLARPILAADGFAFAHRYITRPPFADDENFVSLDMTEFAARRSAGLFAFDWQARGVCYGIGREIEQWRAAGLTVVVSGSRANYVTGAPGRAGAIPVLVDAARQIIALRLASRGRESATEIASRMNRADAYEIDAPGLVRIDNSGLLNAAVSAFVSALRAIRAGSAVSA